MHCEFCQCSSIRWKVPARMLVISGTWLREEVVRNPCQQTRRRMGQHCWKDDAQLCWERASCISGHQCFRRELKSKRRGKKSIHFNGSSVNSVNQLSINGAVSDLCEELDPDSRKQTEGEVWGSMVSTEFSMLTTSLRLQHHWHRRTCCKNTSRNSRNCLKTRNYPNCAPVWRLLKKDNFSLHLMKRKDQMKWIIYVESTHYLEIIKHPEREGGFAEIRKSVQSWMLISWLNPYFETKQFPGFAFVNGNVIKTSEEIPFESVQLVRTGNLQQRLGRGPKPTVTLPTVSVPIHKRKWIDIYPALLNEGCSAHTPLLNSWTQIAKKRLND